MAEPTEPTRVDGVDFTPVKAMDKRVVIVTYPDTYGAAVNGFLSYDDLGELWYGVTTMQDGDVAYLDADPDYDVVMRRAIDIVKDYHENGWSKRPRD